MPTLHLTDTAIRDALSKAKAGERIELKDDVPPFLRVRVSPGLAVFNWLGRNPTTRKPERHKLGIFGPTMGVKLARDAAAKLKGAAHEGKDVAKVKRTAKRAVDAGRATVADMRDAYLARCAKDGKPLAAATQLTYTRILPHLLGEYMDRPIDALDPDKIMELVVAMGKRRTELTKHGRPVKRGNKQGATVAVKALARLCKVHKVVDPTKELREERRLTPVGTRAGRLGTEEAQQLFAWLHWYAAQEGTPGYMVRCARMYMVAIVTGWRISTVRAWEWRDIDFAKMTTQLPHNKSRHTQTLPLWPVLADMLKPLRQKEGLVFDEKYHSDMTDILPWKVSPHDARKAVAALLLDMTNDGDMHSLSVELLMSHFGSVTVKHYLSKTPIPNQVRNLRPAVEKVSAYFAAKIGHKATIAQLQNLANERFAEARSLRGERRKGSKESRNSDRRERRQAGAEN